MCARLRSSCRSRLAVRAVTPVMNAGANCRAGYAITAVGAVESGWKKIHGVLARLSVQQVIDCSDAYMNAGCLGGSIEGSYDYIWANDGLVLETQYPYVGYDKNCGVAASNVQPRSAWIYNWYQVESQSDSALAQAVVFNPTGVYLDTSNSYWMLYTGGVITDPLYCNGGVDDAGLVTGWSTLRVHACVRTRVFTNVAPRRRPSARVACCSPLLSLCVRVLPRACSGALVGQPAVPLLLDGAHALRHGLG
ncbi:hypothetical protein EON62_04995 [archaeon]|nr:MAG: hypothetical protein EON62_04995 [archaeon]